MEYASKGVAGAGLGTGIAGLSLGVLNALGGAGGLLNVLGGGNAVCSENMPVSRYDSQKDAKIAQLETEVKLRDANTYTDAKLNDLRNYVDGKFTTVNDKLCAQAVHNATNDAVLGCMQGQIAALMGLTKTVIPTTSICPEVMPKYNSWTAPTATAGA
ncbi:MAG: hypothetical protein IJD60_04845 [Clostridia bacterium]|nr:hypothetical protein [Clostridia bacterium]